MLFWKMGDISAHLYADRNNPVEMGNPEDVASWLAEEWEDC